MLAELAAARADEMDADTVNRELSIARKAIGWWQRQGWIGSDPTIGIERRPAPPDRTRALTAVRSLRGYFVGAGLLSGAVVHHPLDPARYSRIAVYGVLVFLAATALNEFVLASRRPTLPRALAVMGASLLLPFGPRRSPHTCRHRTVLRRLRSQGRGHLVAAHLQSGRARRPGDGTRQPPDAYTSRFTLFTP
ncbi:MULTISPECIES: hypothetical protein [Streptomyces]|uniref:hypothetical protein n=1 Tax=Streptomyces TaxID=1883 RepID=UPI00224DA19B|nr:hypothetical protein [Streptomyces erythrochromogenes]MCX5582952.1 hypothetical protein [Streptomyces erythrochromogenes]